MLRLRLSPPRIHRGALGLGLILASCAAPRTRPVVDVDPLVTRVEVVSSLDSDAMSIAGSGDAETRPLRARPRPENLAALMEAAARTRDDQLGAARPFEKMMGDDGPTQLDPEQGPIDLGLRVHINFGASQAPYDDAMQPIHGVVPGRSGFSDSVLQLSWRERVGDGYGNHGTAAITRYQDEAIVDGLSDAEFTWFVFGIHSSF